MAFTALHPAPGLGELMPGFYTVPQNPITMAQTGMGYVPHMGELLPGAFSIPENPIVKNFATGMQGLGTLGCTGLGCGQPGFTGSLAGGLSGLGEFNLSQIIPDNWDWKTWGIVAVGALVLLSSFRPGRSQRNQELADARHAYQKRTTDIKGRYGTVGSRAYRHITA